MNWLEARFGSSSRIARRPARRSQAIRPGLESLEGRQVLSVMFHGGPVISHVQVDSVYWGRGWSRPANQINQAQLDGFLQTVVHSSYMSMLGEYGVGEGSFGTSDVVSGRGSPAAGATVSEKGIQRMLSAEIRSGHLPEPTGFQLYFVYLPPNVHSRSDPRPRVLGHHSTFNMPSGPVHYAVIPNPVGNSDLPDLTTFQQQTAVTSHELAEGVTDPNGRGWWDSDPASGEIGDITSGQFASIDGYVVQREWSAAFNASMAPLYDTSWLGTASYSPFMLNSDSTTVNGRTLRVGIGLDHMTYCNWEISPGNNAGWFIIALA
jgi:hypothetical protein